MVPFENLDNNAAIALAASGLVHAKPDGMAPRKILKALYLCLAGITLLSASESAAEPVAKTEMSAGFGIGVDQTVKGDEGGGIAISGGLLWDVGSEWVLGARVQIAPNIFSGSNTHAGVAFGNAGRGSLYWQGLVEAGIHHRSGIGDDLFTTSDADAVDLPYVGATTRLVFDVFAPGGFLLELNVSGKRDIGTHTQEVRTESCLLGCTSQYNAVVTGGWHLSGGFGFSYRI